MANIARHVRQRAGASPLESAHTLPGWAAAHQVLGLTPSQAELRQALATYSGAGADRNGTHLVDHAHHGSYRPLANAPVFDFDGSNDKIDVPVETTDANISISCWLNFDSLATHEGIVFSRDTGVCGLSISAAGTQFGYTWGNDPATYGWPSGLAITTGVWYFVCLVVEPTKATIYVAPKDGELVSAVRTLAHADVTCSDWVLGADTGVAGRNFDGKMHDVRFHSRPLTASEIVTLLNEPWTFRGTTDLEGHYLCEDAAGGTALDSSPHQRHGTISGHATNFFATSSGHKWCAKNRWGYSDRRNIVEYSNDLTRTSFWSDTNGPAITPSYPSVETTPNGEPYTTFVNNESNSNSQYILGLTTGVVGRKYKVGGYLRVVNSISSWAVSAWDATQAWVISPTLVAQGDGWVWGEVEITCQNASLRFGFRGAPTFPNGDVEINAGSFIAVDVTNGDVDLLAQYVRTEAFAIESDQSSATLGSVDAIGNTLTYSGECPRDAQLIQSHCLTFDGVDDYVRCDCNVTSYPFTMEAWAQHDTSSSDFLLTLTDQSLDTRFLSLAISGGDDFLEVARRNTTLYQDASSLVVPSGWNHLVVVFVDETTVRLYVNGVEEVLSGMDSVVLDANFDAFLVGNLRVPSPAQLWSGSVAGARIYDDALTAEQIVERYTKRAAANISVPAVVSLPLSEGVGTDRVHDASGNGNHGDMIGFASTCWDVKQDVYHANAVNGFSYALNEDFTGWVVGSNLPDNTTIEFEVKSTEEQFILFSDGGTESLFIPDDGSATTSFDSVSGSAVYLIDGVADPMSNRDELHAMICDGDWHTVKITGLDFATDGLTTLYLGNYNSDAVAWRLGDTVVRGLRINGEYIGPQIPAADDGLDAYGEGLSNPPRYFPAPETQIDKTGGVICPETAGLTADWAHGEQLPATEFDRGDAPYLLASKAVTSLPFTISAWVRKDDTTGDYVCSVVDEDNGSKYFAIDVKATSGVVRVHRRNTSLVLTETSLVISPGSWQHVAVVCESETAFTVYVDGVAEQHTGLSSVSMSADFDAFVIGTFRVTAPASYWDGGLSDVRLYSGAKTAAEIDAIRLGYDDQTDRVLRWSGGSLRDSDGNDLTLTGSVTHTTETVDGEDKFSRSLYAFGSYMPAPVFPYSEFDDVDGYYQASSGWDFSSHFDVAAKVYWDGSGTARILGAASGSFRIEINSATVITVGAVAGNVTVATLPTNTWFDLRVVRQAGVASVYVDGVLQGTVSYAADFGTLDAIGQGNGTGFYGGRLSRVQITDSSDNHYVYSLGNLLEAEGSGNDLTASGGVTIVT